MHSSKHTFQLLSVCELITACPTLAFVFRNRKTILPINSLNKDHLSTHHMSVVCGTYYWNLDHLEIYFAKTFACRNVTDTFA